MAGETGRVYDASMALQKTQSLEEMEIKFQTVCLIVQLFRLRMDLRVYSAVTAGRSAWIFLLEEQRWYPLGYRGYTNQFEGEYNIVFIILGLVIPVTLAIMISLIYSKFKSKVYQTLMFFPHFMSWVVASYFVFAFLSPDKGILNQIITHFGGQGIQWYSNPKYWPLILVIMNLWKTVGYSMVVYLASITGIDGSLYEAAVIDGATKFQQARYITIPSIKPIVIMMFILNVGKIFYSDFGLFYQVTQGIPNSLYKVASTFDTYIYNALQTNVAIGKTAAAGFFQSIACCITILLANYIVSKIDSDSAII